MGAYNLLRLRERCPRCGRDAELLLQFKYGDTWQIEYELGAVLKWGGNDIGSPQARRVVLDAAAEPCSSCGLERDFEIFVEDGRLVKAQPSKGDYDFAGRQESFIELDSSTENPDD